MKPYLKTGLMALFIMLFSTIRNQANAQPPGRISYQTFYDELSPYGEWIDYPEYGYAWHPRIDDFRPYNTGGHWAWTDEYGWMWASDYDWGWAPFHYGRWQYDDWYGWVWIPGYDWSPGWVEWRDGGDYYGWAPLGPGININIGRYSPPDYYWNFVPRRYITSPRIYDYCIPYSRNVTIINTTTIINNRRSMNSVFVSGPDRYEVERYTNQRINPYRFRESDRPGRTIFRDNEVNIYRPQVDNTDNRKFSPRRFEHYETRNGNVRNGNTNDNNNRQGGTIFQRRDQDNGNGFDRQRNVIEQQPGRIQKQREIEQQPQMDPQRKIAQDEQRRFQQQQEQQRIIQQQQAQQEQQKRIEQQQAQQEQQRRMEQQRVQQEQQRRMEQQRQSQQQAEPRRFDQQRQQNGNFERRQSQPVQQPNNENGKGFEKRQENAPQQSNGNGNGKAWGRRRN